MLGKFLYCAVWLLGTLFFNNYVVRALSFLSSVLFFFMVFTGLTMITWVSLFLITGVIQP